MKRRKGSVPSGKLFDQISVYWVQMADAHSTDIQIDFVKNNIPAEGLILDLDCGHGRHAVPLSKVGFSIVGLDISRQLLSIARQRAAGAGLELPLVLADMRFLPFRSEVFTAVVSLDSSFGYLPSEDEDLQSLLEVARTLVVNGFFLIDVFNRGYLIERQSSRLKFGFYRSLFGFTPKLTLKLVSLITWKEYPTFYLHEEKRVNGKGTALRHLWILRDKTTAEVKAVQHIVRLYELAKLKMLLQQVGLQITRTFGNYIGESYSERSKRLIIKAELAREPK